VWWAFCSSRGPILVTLNSSIPPARTSSDRPPCPASNRFAGPAMGY
jgi:hypothetical protein